MSKGAFNLALFLAAAGVAVAAQATTTTSPDSTERGPKSATVRYHEEDLATSRGAERLYSSLDRAARDVCDDTGEYDLRTSFAACERNAIGNAVAEVGNAKLTQIYDEHFPKAVTAS